MKTDVILINSTGEGMDAALAETEKAAAYRGLNAKEALRLRLLSEELMGMLRTIVGEKDARYWIEADGKAFSLHLAMKTRMNADLREELLDATTTGRNEAAKGFMGRLLDILSQMGEQDDVGVLPMRSYGFYPAADMAGAEAPMHGMMYSWSLQTYRDDLDQHREEEAEKWDELEKSITAKLADEVKIFIHGGDVEMVVEKAF